MRLFLLMLVLLFPATQDVPFIPPDRQPITAETASQIVQLGAINGGWSYADAVWSPDGSLIAVATRSGAAIYDPDDLYRAPIVLTDPTVNQVTDIWFTPDSRQVITANWDGLVSQWSIDSESIIQQWDDNSWKPLLGRIMYSPDGELSVSVENVMTIRDTQTGAEIMHRLGQPLRFDEEGNLYYQDRNEIKFWSRDTGESDLILYDPTIESAELSADLRLLITSHIATDGHSRSMSLWDFRLREIRASVPLPEDSRVYVSPDSHWIITADWLYRSEPQVWSVTDLLNNSDTQPRSLDLPERQPITTILFSPVDTRAVIIGWDGNHSNVEGDLWMINLDDLDAEPTVLRYAATDFALNNDGTRLLFMGNLWDLITGRELAFTNDTIWEINDTFTTAQTLEGIQYATRRSTCEHYADACPNGFTVMRWDIVSGEQIGIETVEAYNSSPAATPAQVLSPDGRLRILQAEYAREFDVYDAVTNELLYTHATYDLPINVPPLFSPDSQLLAIKWGEWGSANFEIIDAATGEQQIVIEGIERHIRGMAFSPDSSLFAFTDGSHIRIWQSGRLDDFTISSIPADRTAHFVDINFWDDGELLVGVFEDYDNMPIYMTYLWSMRNSVEITQLRGRIELNQANLLLTSDRGVMHIWGIPAS